MRVGVIRGDIPSPLFLADLEPTSGFNPPTEPVGQTRYVSRPNATYLTNFLAGVYADDASGIADIGDGPNDDFVVPNPGTLPIPAGAAGYGGVPAGVQGTALTFPVTVGASNSLEVANSTPPSYSTVLVAAGAYATMTALLAAINLVLKPTGLATATTDTATGTHVVIQSSVPGVGSFIEVGPGTINATLGLTTSQTFTMPAATAIITAMNPVVVSPATGSLNVSAANILTTLGASPAAAQVANLIAPQFQETQVAIQSFQVGGLSQYLYLSWNPDSRLGTTTGVGWIGSNGYPTNLPLPNGPAIQVVQNDGVTPFASDSLAALPMITAAVHNSPNPGDITITGMGLGNVELFNSTTVIVRAAASTVAYGHQAGLGGVPYIKLQQQKIISTFTGGTQGVVSATSIVIPASLLTYNPPGTPFPPSSSTGQALGVAGSTVEIRYTTLANTNYGTAASVSAWAANVATISGLTNQTAITPGDGYSITVSGAASAGNNGTFEVLSVVSATTITVSNIYGVAGDANNGALVWSEPAPVAFVVT